MPLGAWYHATKHALEGWSDCLRLETAPFNIQVVLIQPGAIRTGFFDVVSTGLKKYCGDDTAYKAQVEPFFKMMDDPKALDRGTDPGVLAEVFVEAATTDKQRRRYVKGAMARPLMFVRKWFGGAYEAMLRRSLR